MALAKRVAVVIDGATGKEVARLTDFASPIDLAFEAVAARRLTTAAA